MEDWQARHEIGEILKRRENCVKGQQMYLTFKLLQLPMCLKGYNAYFSIRNQEKMFVKHLQHY